MIEWSGIDSQDCQLGVTPRSRCTLYKDTNSTVWRKITALEQHENLGFNLVSNLLKGSNQPNKMDVSLVSNKSCLY